MGQYLIGLLVVGLQEVVLNCSETGNEYMPIVCEGIIE